MKEIVRDITKQVEVRSIEFQPGNGTRYSFLVIPAEGLGIDGAESGGYAMVAMIEPTDRCYTFATHGALAPGYVKEKLGGFDGDAKVMAEAITEVLSREERERPLTVRGELKREG